MIYSLKGIIEKKLPTFVIVDVNGVGYGVTVSAQTSSKLPALNEHCFLIIHHHITEIGQSLFGFIDESEKSLFELLITVKGIGPKMGISILSGMSSDQIKSTIAQADANLLSKIPGIGKKTAERIILELKDKLSSISDQENLAESSQNSLLAQDAISALSSLGYKAIDASKHVQQLLKTKPTYSNASDLVRDALKSMNA